ncbi:MAG: hypothetical protein ACM358_05635 [Gemmatimonadota bacterium]
MAVAIKPLEDIDLVAALRRQLDAADAHNAKLVRQLDEATRQVEDLRSVLSGTAGDLVDSSAVHTRDRVFWSTAYYSERARFAAALVKLEQLEKWHREQGEESARLQAQLEVEREETAQVSRLLDASEERVRQLEAHVARLVGTIENREID